MKQFITLALVVAGLFISCASKEQRSAVEAVPAEGVEQTEQAIHDRLCAIYADAQQRFNVVVADSLYMSADYNRLQNEAMAIGERLNDLVIDSDHWVQGQDAKDPSVEVKTVTVDDATHATAKVVVTNFGKPTEVTLLLVHERGDWYVDNMLQMWEDELIDEKAWLQNYVSMNQNSK